MNENLRILKDLYGHARETKESAEELFLKKAFENRTEYALPLWLVQDRRDAGELINTWCPYRHDGAFIGIGKVMVQKSEYLVSGFEDMEYCSDYMQDVETYERDAVAKFILDWLNDDMDSKLEALAVQLKDLDENDEDTILSKVEDLLSGDSDLEPSEILKWAKEFVPFTEKKLRRVKVEWDTDGKTVDSLPEEVEIPDEVTDEEISDWLSDKYGFCHKGYCFI